MTTLARMFRWHRPLMGFAAAMGALAVIAAVGVVVDDRILVGAPIWLKPMKFAISFALYAVTLAWMLSLMRRSPRWGWWTATVIATASTIEMAIIVGQVVRGRQSHFNAAADLDGMLFSIMGATIAVLWLANVLIAVLLLRERLAGPALMWAIRLGMIVMIGGLSVGALMLPATPEQRRVTDSGAVATTIGAHSVGVPDGGPSLPLTGWSTTGGDLRIPHFIGMHALQALPLLLLVLGGFTERIRLRLVWVAAGTYGAVVALTTWQALRGQPLLQPDRLTLGAAALVLTAAVAGGLTAVRIPVRAASGHRERVTAHV